MAGRAGEQAFRTVVDLAPGGGSRAPAGDGDDRPGEDAEQADMTAV